MAEALRADVIALGPGLSRNPETLERARELVERVEAPLVLDADGLNAFEGLGFHRMHGPGVLTPHYAEAARLSGQSIAEIARDPARWARRFADESHAIVCLKSTPMITAVLAEPMILNGTGNPGMATAGAGDVLTGTIAGLIAQGVDAQEAAVLGCFLHGLAGEAAARRPGRWGSRSIPRGASRHPPSTVPTSPRTRCARTSRRWCTRIRPGSPRSRSAARRPTSRLWTRPATRSTRSPSCPTRPPAPKVWPRRWRRRSWDRKAPRPATY